MHRTQPWTIALSLFLGLTVVGLLLCIGHVCGPPAPLNARVWRRGCTDTALAAVPVQHQAAADKPAPAPASYRHVVLLQRWEGVGRDRSGTRNDVKFMAELVRRHALYFPRGTALRVAPFADTTEALVAITTAQLHAGERLFVGVLTSGDLRALKPLAQLFPDAMFISTASTAPGLALPDNVFRLSCPDHRIVQHVGPLLDHTFPQAKKWVVQVDRTSEWARQLHTMLRFHLHPGAELQMVHSWGDVDVGKVEGAAPHLGLMAITEDDATSMSELRAQPWFTSHTTRETPLVFADASAFSQAWSGRPVFYGTPMPIFAFTSLKMLAAVTIAQNVLGPSVGPFLANLLLAGRLGVQGLILARNMQDADEPFHGRQVIQRIAASRHTATGTGMFDDNGDRADIEVGVVEWVPTDARWRVVTTAGRHHALGPFDATFSSPAREARPVVAHGPEAAPAPAQRAKLAFGHRFGEGRLRLPSNPRAPWPSALRGVRR